MIKFNQNLLFTKTKKILEKTREGQCLLSLINSRIRQNNRHHNGNLANGDPETFGYLYFGPLVVGFCHWIFTLAEKYRIPQLNFLSRDARVCFEVWQLLYENSTLETQYLLTSRRATSVASIQTLDDCLGFVREIKFSQPINQFFQNRFSFPLDASYDSLLKKVQLNFKDSIHFRKNLKQLQIFIKSIWPELNISIQDERNAYLQYLSDKKIKNHAGVIDLGYSGTIQKYLFLLTRKQLHGLYVGTSFKVGKLDSLNLPVHSFIIDRANRHTNHPFFRNIPLIEYIFLAQDNSLTCFKKNKDQVEPVFYSPELELYQHRVNLTRQIHEGILSFAKDWRDNFGQEVTLQNPMLAFELCRLILENPSKEDARIFTGHYFEDNYGRENKSICLLSSEEQFKKKNHRQAIKNSQWKIAAYILANRSFLGKYWLSRIKRSLKQLFV